MPCKPDRFATVSKGSQLVCISQDYGVESATIVTVISNDGVILTSDGRYYKLNGCELHPKILNKHRLVFLHGF